MKRRPNGTGTIEPTPTGKWRARFSFDGKTREAIEGSPFDTYEQAELALDGVLALLEAAPVEGMSLLRLGEKAFKARELEGFRAVDDDRWMWDRHIAKWDVARGPARLVTRGDIRERIASLRNKRTGKPLATQTKRNVRNMLSVVYAYGCEKEIVTANPCLGFKVKAVASTVESSTFLAFEEAEALIGAATDPVIPIAIGTGARSGELRSLLWKDVHTEGASPHVVIRYGKPGEPPKNGKIRSVPLFGIALAAFASMTRGEDAAPVFPSFSGWHRQKGRVVEPDDWKAWKLSAGIERPVRFHDLRHTCATLLLSGAWGRSWSYEEVKEMLGHSSVKVTERYAHAVGTLASRAGRAMRSTPELSTDCPPAERAIMTQAREMIGRCGWDLNPHMPVLQTGHTHHKKRGDEAAADSTWANVRRYALAVAAGDPLAHARGLDLAESVLELLGRAARERAS